MLNEKELQGSELVSQINEKSQHETEKQDSKKEATKPTSKPRDDIMIAGSYTIAALAKPMTLEYLPLCIGMFVLGFVLVLVEGINFTVIPFLQFLAPFDHGALIVTGIGFIIYGAIGSYTGIKILFFTKTRDYIEAIANVRYRNFDDVKPKNTDKKSK